MSLLEDGAQTAPLVDHTDVAATEPLGRRTRDALEQLEREQGQVARWEAARAVKQAELDDLERRIGDEVLAADDEAESEAVADRLTAQVTKLRTGIEIDTRTIDAAAGRVRLAQFAVLAAEADDLRDVLAAAERRKTEHDERLRALLQQVSDHDGARYVAWEPARDDVLAFGRVEYTPSKSELLGGELVQLRLRLELLEAAAAGRPVPTFRQMQPIPYELYSPRVKGTGAYFPELVAGLNL
ncbi:MAG: hypothetical protein M3P31_04875 [Actinomycetota bacterium]|nr:hypothetical protein [Actinomycetota bacterium]